MQVVSAIWYRVYFGWMLTIGIILVIAGLLARYAPGLHFLQFDGLTVITVAVAGAQVLLSLIAAKIIPWNDWPLTTRISLCMLGLTLLGCLSQSSGVAQMIYVVIWVVMIVGSGILGIKMLFAALFATLSYTMVVNNFQIHNLNKPSLVLLAASLVFGIGSYQVWRRVAVTTKRPRISKLAGPLRSSEQQSQEIIIGAIADGVVVFDKTGKINLINPAAASLTEWTAEDALGIDVHLVLKLAQENGQPLDSGTDPLTAALTSKVSSTYNLQLKGRVNKQTVINLVISPIVLPPDNQIGGAVAVMHDITEQRKEEAQRAEFISTASHEMRTPVAAIEGYLALALNDKVSTIDSRARGYLDKAHQSTQHLGELFQDLLTSAKAEDGRLINHPEVVEIQSFLKLLAEDLKFSAQKKGLTVDFLVGSPDVIDTSNNEHGPQIAPLYYVFVDPDRLREVITNLFDNAVKYTDRGQITLGLTGDDDVVQIYVRDTGAGIPSEDIPHLFQKFYRVDNSATRTIGGSGLGLFICRKIIDLYHGRLWVESAVGRGSTFYINLPRLTSQRADQLKSGSSSQATVVAPGSPATTRPAVVAS